MEVQLNHSSKPVETDAIRIKIHDKEFISRRS